MKYPMAILILTAPMLAPIAAWSADDPDASFYKNAAEGGLFEVDTGNLAQQKGTSQAIKDFGGMMVKDHGAADDKLQALASGKGISLPTSAGLAQIATEGKLKIESGDTFDKAYIESQIKAHRMTIKLFKKEIASGQDADARAFAAATLPTIRSHLSKIDAIAKDAGIATK